MVGPRIGPSITPTPHSAIAVPCWRLGKVSSVIAWESGTSGAPNMPWQVRQRISSGSEEARPHKSVLTVKPITAPTSRRLRPRRAASQPVGGVAIAVATMLKVRTHAIWSIEAERSPCICGSATFAMVSVVA